MACIRVLLYTPLNADLENNLFLLGKCVCVCVIF